MDDTSQTVPAAARQSPEDVGAALEPWLRERFPDADAIDLPVPARPKVGGSSETLFLNPVIRESGVERHCAWVLRIEATEYQIYQDPSVERQFRTLDTLGRLGDMRIPKVLWYEPDRRTLGAPFFVMECVSGRLPENFHHRDGLFAEARPAERENMWLSAIEAMARIHNADPALFRFLARPELGDTGLDQEFAFWEGYGQWTGAPVRLAQERALQWLHDHLPPERGTGLAWGDARPGNIIFDGNICRALIDWETVSLGGAETDLGWWLFYDWFVSEGRDQPRLEGLGTRLDAITAWEGFAGRKAEAMEWHEVFATWRFSLISDRALHLTRDRSVAEAIETHGGRPIADRLAQLVGG